MSARFQPALHGREWRGPPGTAVTVPPGRANDDDSDASGAVPVRVIRHGGLQREWPSYSCQRHRDGAHGSYEYRMGLRLSNLKLGPASARGGNVARVQLKFAWMQWIWVPSRASRGNTNTASRLNASSVAAAADPPTSSGQVHNAARTSRAGYRRQARSARGRQTSRALRGARTGSPWPANATASSDAQCLNFAASSEPPVALPLLYECAPVPASWPSVTIWYSLRVVRPAKKSSRISRTPAA